MPSTKLLAIQTIPDLDDDTLNYWLKKAREALRRNAVKVGTHNGASIYMSGDNSNNFVSLVYGDELLYTIRSHSLTFAGHRFGQQVMAIRNTEAVNQTPSALFAKRAILGILLPKYGTLVSDQQMTQSGRRVWDAMVSVAFRRGLHIYLYDRRRTPNEVIPLKNFVEYGSEVSRIYGTEDGFKRVLTVISQTQLK